MNLMRNGKMPTVTIEQAQKNFCKVCALVLEGMPFYFIYVLSLFTIFIMPK